MSEIPTPPEQLVGDAGKEKDSSTTVIDAVSRSNAMASLQAAENTSREKDEAKLADIDQQIADTGTKGSRERVRPNLDSVIGDGAEFARQLMASGLTEIEVPIERVSAHGMTLNVRTRPSGYPRTIIIDLRNEREPFEVRIGHDPGSYPNRYVNKDHLFGAISLWPK